MCQVSQSTPQNTRAHTTQVLHTHAWTHPMGTSQSKYAMPLTPPLANAATNLAVKCHCQN